MHIELRLVCRCRGEGVRGEGEKLNIGLDLVTFFFGGGEVSDLDLRM